MASAAARGPGGARADCQVLIVGAGPTGLVLGAELLAQGIHARIIDKGDGVILQSRAIGIHARTLEVLDMMGIAERFTDRGQIVRRFCYYSQGRRLASLDLTRCGSRFGFLLDLPQDQTESLLRARVSELGGGVEQGVELISLSGGPDAVMATVREGTGQVREITARYVVGCDGAHSRVRHELGLAFHGHPYAQDWLLADARLDWQRREDEAHAFFRPDGLPLICFPLREHRWRLILPYAGDRDGQAPTLQEVQQLAGQRAPEPVTVSDPTWLANFRCHRRSASAYRRGRVILAGDAVHIHTPAGGQGMNTGIMDAHNLAWKLALVVSGRAPSGLLDTYGTERGPVAAEVLRLTHAIVWYSTLSHPLKQRARNVIVPAAGRVPLIQRRAARRLSQVYVGYPAGPLTRPDRWRDRPRPGQRVPDIEVLTGEQTARLHSVLRRGQHVLVVPEAAGASMFNDGALQPYQNDVCVVTGAVQEKTWIRNHGPALVVLVRPDGWVAARGTPECMTQVTGYLREVFGEPAGQRLGEHSAEGALHTACGTPARLRTTRADDFGYRHPRG
jgi:2-polyprenyl-6-methoxyphenol hydroxylase-like FAD-dependent oxidoreductase